MQDPITTWHNKIERKKTLTAVRLIVGWKINGWITTFWGAALTWTSGRQGNARISSQCTFKCRTEVFIFESIFHDVEQHLRSIGQHFFNTQQMTLCYHSYDSGRQVLCRCNEAWLCSHWTMTQWLLRNRNLQLTSYSLILTLSNHLQNPKPAWTI